MNQRLLFVALIAAAFGYPLAPAFGEPAEAPAQAERPVVRLVIDTSGMFEDDREDTARWIREAGLPVLADAGVAVDDASTALELRVVVMVEGVGYAVETSVWKPGSDEPELDRGRRVCDACVRSEVVQLVTRELAWLGGRLTVEPTPTTSEPATTQGHEPEVDDASDDATPPTQDRTDKPSNVLRNAGLALVVPGGVTLGVGIGLVAAGVREVDEPDPLRMAERNYRPPGVALAVSGGVVVAAGVAVLVVHVLRARNGKGHGVAWAPALVGARAGVAVAGRF